MLPPEGRTSLLSDQKLLLFSGHFEGDLELQPTQSSVLVQDNPKVQEEANPKLRPKANLGPLSPLDVTRTLLSGKHKQEQPKQEPKVKETSTQDFGPDPLKIFTLSLLSKTFGTCFL